MTDNLQAPYRYPLVLGPFLEVPLPFQSAALHFIKRQGRLEVKIMKKDVAEYLRVPIRLGEGIGNAKRFIYFHNT
jgi:hypothetical protein